MVLQATAVEAPDGSYCGDNSTTSAATIFPTFGAVQLLRAIRDT